LGIDEYREDPSRGISGIRVFNNGRSIEISYESLVVTMLYGGIWTNPLPRHRLQHIPIVDMATHPYLRTDIIGNGPFLWTGQWVDGQEVVLAANPNHWLGRPQIDYLNISVILPDLVGEAMLAGTFDIIDFNPVHLPDYGHRFEDAGTITLVSALARLFSFMGFRFGTMDHETQTMIPNPDTIINCLALRRALGYARNDIDVAVHIFDNLRFPLGSTVIPWSGPFVHPTMVGFSVFDVDKANELLDEAGYEWRPGETYRRHKDTGEFFHLYWAVHNNATNPLLAAQHIDDWRDYIGIEVRLWTGGMMEFNDRIETLQFDTDNGMIHMFDSAWNKGSNPDPRGLWGYDSTHNDTRWTHPETDAILRRFGTDEVWDMAYLTAAMHDWQEAVYRHAPWIPVMTSVSLVAVNNRVLNYSLERRDGMREVGSGAVHLWALSRDTPYRAN
jgi:peptide/nickel transport system substrate-binding protein